MNVYLILHVQLTSKEKVSEERSFFLLLKKNSNFFISMNLQLTFEGAVIGRHSERRASSSKVSVTEGGDAGGGTSSTGEATPEDWRVHGAFTVEF